MNILAIVATVLTLAATQFVPTDAERARWTMGDMHSWAIVLNAMQKDGAAPDVKSIDELQQLAQPKYINSAPTRDAWGTPYRVSKDANGTLRVISAGADGKFDESTWTTGGEQESYAADAIVTGVRGPMFRHWQYR